MLPDKRMQRRPRSEFLMLPWVLRRGPADARRWFATRMCSTRGQRYFLTYLRSSSQLYRPANAMHSVRGIDILIYLWLRHNINAIQLHSSMFVWTEVWRWSCQYGPEWKGSFRSSNFSNHKYRDLSSLTSMSLPGTAKDTTLHLLVQSRFFPWFEAKT